MLRSMKQSASGPVINLKAIARAIPRCRAANSPKPRLHNPDKLTPEQVNPPVKKYRLLDGDEIKLREFDYPDAIQEWDRFLGWLQDADGYDPRKTYRTTLTRAELARLK